MTYKAVEIITSQALKSEQDNKETINRILAGVSVNTDIEPLKNKLLYDCDVTINFHPDRLSNNGKLIIENLLIDGEYHNKWIQQIIDLQHENGSWGCFHTLSQPTKAQPMTTEKALRRLRILGLTKHDEPIARAITYMEQNLIQPFPTVFHEKKHDSKTYGDLMLATWIRLFDSENEAALVIAKKWANIINSAFQNGVYSNESYVSAYEAEFIKLNPKAGCLADFVVFYQLALLPGLLEPKVENAMLDYVLSHSRGIVYIYNSPVNVLPEMFVSKKANWYLSAIELLAAYGSAPQKLGFVAKWLLDNNDTDGMWDMGATVKDGIHFPLSESWRKPEDRKRDCTVRIKKLIERLA